MNTTAAAAATLNPWDLFIHADVVVKAIIAGLVIASLVSWALIADKLVQFARLQRWAQLWLAASGSRESLAARAEASQRERDPAAKVHDAVIGEWKTSLAAHLQYTSSGRDGIKERLARVAQIATGVELDALQRGLPLLATVGSVGPFVGLFGTVWGIMHAFQGIAASNDTSLTVVAPGIAEALFATALGLIAAIPAVVAYNRLSRDLGVYANRLGTLSGLLEVHLSRELEPLADAPAQIAQPAPSAPRRTEAPARAVHAAPNVGLSLRGA